MYKASEGISPTPSLQATGITAGTFGECTFSTGPRSTYLSRDSGLVGRVLPCYKYMCPLVKVGV